MHHKKGVLRRESPLQTTAKCRSLKVRVWWAFVELGGLGGPLKNLGSQAFAVGSAARTHNGGLPRFAARDSRRG